MLPVAPVAVLEAVVPGGWDPVCAVAPPCVPMRLHALGALAFRVPVARLSVLSVLSEAAPVPIPLPLLRMTDPASRAADAGWAACRIAAGSAVTRYPARPPGPL
ncbi:hypothetical protein OG539_20905 [Actinacidiphila glaucinigra]|uniref:hypothetical protein n=1 Tax=Actinacidiphila glaucinigra TaxID=235986 RepID=UPI00324E8D04